jgi:hypothetical protein
MNRPSFSMRLAGSWLGAMLLLGGCGFVGWAWYEGHLTGWWLLIAAFTTMKTLESVQHVRRYKAWLADWHAMVGRDAALPVRKRGRGILRFFTAIALLLVVGIPLTLPSVEADSPLSQQQLVAAWLAAIVFLVAVVTWRVHRWIKKRRGMDAISGKENDDAVAEWTLSMPVSSPSRAEAQRELPEYCARLIGPGYVGVGARKP